MTKFTVALREIATYKEVLRSQVPRDLNLPFLFLILLFTVQVLNYFSSLQKFLELRGVGTFGGCR